MEIQCKASQGMFSDELKVEIDTGYDHVEFFASSDLVKNGRVSLRKDSENEVDVFVFIPGEIIKGNRFVRIKKSILNI